MRRVRYTIVPIVLIATAVFVLWFTQEPAGHEIEVADLPHNEVADAPLEDAPIDPSTPPNDPKVPTETPDDRPDETEEVEIELRGRIVPSGWPESVMNDLLDLDLSVRVTIEFPGREPDDAVVYYLDIEEDWTFRETCDAWDFDFEEEEFAKDWKALLGGATWSAVLVEGMDMLPEPGPGESLPGLTTPTFAPDAVVLPDLAFTPDSNVENVYVLTGTIVHESGTPLMNCRELELHWETKPGWSSYGDTDFNTDDQGRFALAYTQYDLPGIVTKWELYATDDSGGYPALGGCKLLESPQVRGSILDFGKITVGGALVMVNIEGNFHEEDYVVVEFDGESIGHEVDLKPGKPAAAIWLHAGRHNWYAYAYSERNIFNRHKGLLMLALGDVKTIDVNLTKYETVPVKIEEAAGQTIMKEWVTWRLKDGDDEIEDGSAPRRVRQFLVPAVPGLVTEVRAGAHDCESARGEVRHGDESLTLVVRKKQPEPPPEKAIVRVRLAGADPALKDLECDIVFGRTYHLSTTLESLSDTGIELETKPGEHAVTLHGGGYYGFPGGILSGPVTIAAIPGQTVEVLMPMIPPLPWEHKASEIVADIKVVGRSANIETRVFDGVRPRSFEAKLNDGKNVGYKFSLTHMLDGDEQLSFDLKQPEESGGKAVVSIDLEARIEVRVKRLGKPMDGFKVVAKSKHEYAMCHVVGEEGVARAWLPPGEADVTVSYGSDTLYRGIVQVRRGELTVVEVETDKVRVEFVDLDPPKYIGQSDPGWQLLYINELGQWRIHPSSPYGVELLKPGRYRVQPILVNLREAIEFDLTDGQDRVIEIPKLPEIERGDCLLRMDTGVFGDAQVHSSATHIWAGVREEERLGDNLRWWHWGLMSSIVPDGMLVEDIPLGQELILLAGIELETDEDERLLVMKPLKVSFAEPGKSVATEWKFGTPLHDDWHKIDASTVSFVPGYAVPFENDDHAYPGRQEVVFYDRRDNIVLRDWVIVPETTDKFAIPQALRAKLVELGLLEE